VNFTTPAFFAFLPAVLIGYHALRSRTAKYRLLLVASWLFYVSWNPWYLWVLLAPTVVDYWSGLLIDGAKTQSRRKLWLTASLVANLGLLAGFKYTRFAVENACGLFGWTVPPWASRIILPLGISFHTFQGISYTLDVYRRKLPVVRSFTDFALFVAFFPQLVAGPIVRAVEFLPQMATPPRPTPEQITDGLHLFVRGLFKKVFIADRLAQFVDMVFANPAAFDPAAHRWAILAYAGQIYCDFSGYSDLAVGCAKWFGFELPENFNLPYLASSIADFWRRWHMTLSRWMRDYLYISLGGSRAGEGRTYGNLILTMTLCGLWHGASWNYVLWGFYNGVLLAGHRIYDRSLTGRPWAEAMRGGVGYRFFARAATLLQVFIGYVFVRSQNWHDCWRIQTSLCGGIALGSAMVPVWVPALVGLVAIGHLYGGWREARGTFEWPAPVRGWAYAMAVAAVVVLGPGVGKAFIYFQF
jgi:alginate O-acetyltransferase complex protein AlgI